MKNLIIYMLAFNFMLGIVGCKKFLDERPQSNLGIPVSVSDFQSLLDNYAAMNYKDLASAEMVAGDFYLLDADFASRSEEERRLYLWETSNVSSTSANDWIDMYNMVYRANTVIEGSSEVKALKGNVAWNNVLGQGYYYRAKCFLQLVGSYALIYDKNKESPGIPLRLNTDFNEQSVRATVNESYRQIVTDLRRAIPLLTADQIHVLRPSKAAAFGLLARTLLIMGDYAQAGLYADSCLKLKSDLIDYNTLNLAKTNPFVAFNNETLHYTRFQNPSSLSNIRAKIDLDVINSYAVGDLRKAVFYRVSGVGYAMRGSYSGETIPFGGVATDEVYLIKAECDARAGKVQESMLTLNTLLKTRWDKTRNYVALVASSKEVALSLVLSERRKELILRGLRWTDIKRLNREGAGISLSRTVNGKIYQLPANSPRFANPIPEGIIDVSGMEQNSY